MKRVLCSRLPKPGESVELSEDESKHLVQVFRLRNGDTVEALDGNGHAMLTTLRFEGKRTFLENPGTLRSSAPGEVLPISLEIAVLKGDAMDWVVEKAVELGVRELIPVVTAYTVVQMDRKGPEAFRGRWQKIADQALKQCGRLEKMDVSAPVELAELLQKTRGKGLRFWCDEDSRGTFTPLAQSLREPLKDPVRILIGPEGGWNDREREMLASLPAEDLRPVSLGPLVLRAETAAIHAAGLVASELRLRLAVDKDAATKGI